MSYIEPTECCGLSEICGLNDSPEYILRSAWEDHFLDNGECCFYIFSEIIVDGNGKELKDYIKKEKLGRVTSSGIRKNPNTGNKLKVYLWHVNRVAFKKWGKDRDLEDRELDTENY